MPKKEVLFTGGGSGGHITPNLAVIEHLIEKKLLTKEQLVYVGGKYGMEKDIITVQNLDFFGIATGKLRRYFDLRNFIDIFKIMAGTIQAFFLLGKLRPKVIFSKGGYVAVPVVLAARMRRIPVITHESDSVAGLANRIISRFATTICLTFPQKTYTNKEVLTGLPIRSELMKGSKERGYGITGLQEGKPVLLVIGGSLGAEKLNDFVWNNLRKLLEHAQVIHIVGRENKRTDVETAGYVQFEFVGPELKDLYALTDLAVSRAGATTVVELALLGKPMILVPLGTSASRGEQSLNAAYMKDQKAATVLEEQELGEKGVALIQELLQNEPVRQTMSRNTKAIFPENVSEKIAALLLEYTK